MNTSKTDFDFQANASQAYAELKKLIAQQKQVEKAFSKTSATAEKGAIKVNHALNEQAKAIKLLQRDMEKLKTQHEKTGQAGKKQGDITAKAFTTIKAVLGVGGVITVMHRVIDLQKQWNQEIVQSVRAQDEVGRKLQVQALLSDKQLQNVIKQGVLPAANKSGTRLSEAQSVATELVSLGFNVEQATGPALEEILLGARAQSKMEPKEYATAVAGYIKSQGKELNAANARDVSVRSTSLFESTSFQADDFSALAKGGAGLKGLGLSTSDQLSGLTALKELKLEPSEAIKKLRNVALIMSTKAQMDPQKRDMLNQIRPGFANQINPFNEGSSFPQALQILKEGLSTVDPKSRIGILGEVFGKQNVDAAQSLLINPQKFDQLNQMQGNVEGFRKRVELSTQGANANLVRSENISSFDKSFGKDAKYRTDRDLLMKAYEIALRRDGYSEAATQTELALRGTSKEFSRIAGGKNQDLNVDLNRLSAVAPSIKDVWKEINGSAVAPNFDFNADPGRSDIRVAPAFRGQQRSLSLTKEDSTLSVKSEAQQDLEFRLAESQARLARFKLDATAEDSERGSKIGRTESKTIESLSRVIDELNVQLKEMRVENERARRDSNINRNGNT